MTKRLFEWLELTDELDKQEFKYNGMVVATVGAVSLVAFLIYPLLLIPVMIVSSGIAMVAFKRGEQRFKKRRRT